jgi:DNA-binding GntR family transcriptional regulator
MASAAHDAHEAIRRSIIDGTHPPGTMLSENALAATLGVSRTPVRAALARLEDERWLRIYPKRGALVLPIGAEEARDLTRALQAFELTGMRDASPSELERALAALRNQLGEQRAAVDAGDVERLLALSGRFHRTMASAASNRVLADLYTRLDGRRAMLTRSSAASMLRRGDALVAEHARLIDLAEARDWEAFIAALRAHMDDTHSETLGADS